MADVLHAGPPDPSELPEHSRPGAAAVAPARLQPATRGPVSTVRQLAVFAACVLGGAALGAIGLGAGTDWWLLTFSGGCCGAVFGFCLALHLLTRPREVQAARRRALPWTPDAMSEQLASVATAYGLSAGQVRADVRTVVCWVGPNDELLALLLRTHRWPAGRTATYLMALRSVLSRASA